jgi:hypothetical protein
MTERRRVRRLQMQCVVSLWKPSDGTYRRTITENLTCHGFFCQAGAGYVVGDELQAVLELSAPNLNGRDGPCLTLQCRAEVLRIEALESGMACRITGYTVIKDMA